MILKRFFRVATASALAKAWAKKSPLWLAFAVTVMVIRFFDDRAAKRSTGKTAKS